MKIYTKPHQFRLLCFYFTYLPILQIYKQKRGCKFYDVFNKNEVINNNSISIIYYM